MDECILKFITNQKYFTLSTVFNNRSYSAICFYSFMMDEKMLVFKSKSNTRHVVNAIVNPNVSGTITPLTSKLGEIKGLQFEGEFVSLDVNLLSKSQKAYYLKYPQAFTVPGEIWVVKLRYIKMSDSTFGFGKKVIWDASLLENK